MARLKHTRCAGPRPRPYPLRRTRQRTAGAAIDTSERSEDAGSAVGLGSVVEQGVEHGWAAGDVLVESSSTAMSEDAWRGVRDREELRDWAVNEFLVPRSSPDASIESSTTRAELDCDSGSDEWIAATGMDSDDGGQHQFAIPDDSSLPLRLGGRQNNDDEFDRDEICAQAEERDAPNAEASGEFRSSDIDNGDDDSEDDTILVDLDEILPIINALGYASIDDFYEDAVAEENSLSGLADHEADVQEHVDLRYASEDEHHDFIIVSLHFPPASHVDGGPPAAKWVLENLPSRILREDAAGIDPAPCAICQDDILPEESCKILPCDHHYHEGCIMQWLRSRNTCPICRFELPTDDPEYECQKAMRAG